MTPTRWVTPARVQSSHSLCLLLSSWTMIKKQSPKLQVDVIIDFWILPICRTIWWTSSSTLHNNYFIPSLSSNIWSSLQYYRSPFRVSFKLTRPDLACPHPALSPFIHPLGLVVTQVCATLTGRGDISSSWLLLINRDGNLGINTSSFSPPRGQFQDAFCKAPQKVTQDQGPVTGSREQLSNTSLYRPSLPAALFLPPGLLPGSHSQRTTGSGKQAFSSGSDFGGTQTQTGLNLIF